MNYTAYIQELQNISKPLELPHIIWWLTKYEKIFQKTVIVSDCKKWYKWFYRDEKPFPCVCPTRPEDCIFIELYYELQKLLALYKCEIESHQRKLSKDFDLAILEKIEFLDLDSSGHIRIIIATNNLKSESFILNINKDDFKSILKYRSTSRQKTN